MGYENPQTLGQIGNSLVVSNTISKEALRRLINALVFKDLVYRPFERDLNTKKEGKKITFKKPFRTRTSSGKQFVQQPLVDEYGTMTIAHRDHFGTKLTDDDMKYTLQQYSDRYLKSGMAAMANKIDKSIADTIKVQSHLLYGTPGTAITVDGMTFLSAAMDDLGIPDDEMRYMVHNVLDNALIDVALAAKYVEKLAEQAMKRGYTGALARLERYMSSNLTVHTVGTYAVSGSAAEVNGAGQTGSSIVTDGWTSGSFLNAGDVISFEGCYEINPMTYERSNRNKLAQFVVTAKCTADSGGNMTIPISPSLNDGTNTTTDEEGNTVSLAAYQNVSASLANNADITVYGTSATSYRQNLAFHKEACAFAMIDIEIPKSVPVRGRASHEGFSLAMISYANGDDYTEKSRIDAEWGVKLIYPELSMRYYTSALA
jgi:hypothetical protein